MTDTNDGEDMMDETMGGAYPAPPGDEMVRSTTTATADVGLDDGDLVLNSTTVTSDSHHSDSEEEKEEETATNNVDMTDAMMGGAYPALGDELVSSTAIVSVPRSTAAAELRRNGNNASNRNRNEPLVPPAGLTSKARPINDSLNVKEGARNIDPSQRPGAYMARGRPFGSRPALAASFHQVGSPPAWHRRMSARLAASFRQVSSQSLIIAELAGPSQEDEELRRRNQELEQGDEELRRRYQQLEQEFRRRNQALEQIVNGAVQGTVMIENSGGGDNDQNAASSAFGWKGTRFLIAFVLLLVVGVILGVTIPLTTTNNKDKDSLSINSVVTPSQSPTQSPTQSLAQSQSQFPTQSPAPTACTTLDCLAEILLQNEVSGAEALEDDSSPQFRALRWLANEDTAVLDLDSTSTVFLIQRYVLAVLYFATNGEGWEQLKFLPASSVCEWKNGERGVTCNDDDLVVALNLNEIQLTGSIPIELRELTLLELLGLYENQLTGSIPSELGELTLLTELWLNENKLTGLIPSELGELTSLFGLGLHVNQLTGSIPSELGELTLLTELYIDDNQLTGSIPSELGELTLLTELFLEYNQVTGSIPSELGELTSLTWLSLTYNQLTSSIPSELGELTLLTRLYFDRNDLTGDLDPIFCNGSFLNLWIFESDCLSEVVCSCCTECY